MWDWIKWKLKIGWELYMLHVGDECVTEFWKHKKTGEGRSVVYQWNPRKEAR